VPPPINTEMTCRPHMSGNACSRSACSAARYSASGRSPRASWELKSQYGHLRTHHGTGTYKDKGGKGRLAKPCPAAGRTRGRDASSALAGPFDRPSDAAFTAYLPANVAAIARGRERDD